jgi:hypothetical protein
VNLKQQQLCANHQCKAINVLPRLRDLVVPVAMFGFVSADICQQDEKVAWTDGMNSLWAGGQSLPSDSFNVLTLCSLSNLYIHCNQVQLFPQLCVWACVDLLSSNVPEFVKRTKEDGIRRN